MMIISIDPKWGGGGGVNNCRTSQQFRMNSILLTTLTNPKDF